MSSLHQGAEKIDLDLSLGESVTSTFKLHLIIAPGEGVFYFILSSADELITLFGTGYRDPVSCSPLMLFKCLQGWVLALIHSLQWFDFVHTGRQRHERENPQRIQVFEGK